MSAVRIPFNKQVELPGNLDLISEAVKSGQCAGNGPFGKRCETFLEEVIGCRRALMTTSCTHALETVGLLLDLKPGDEVIVPSYTFVSTANAFALRGTTIRFCDIRSDTLNLDESLLESLVNEKTRLIVPVHYAGVACEMEAIMKIAGGTGIEVAEDNAHGLFASYQGEPLGTFGTFATQSFHETKNFSCGEGGALLLNREDLIERAEIVRDKGTDRSQFFRGEVDKYGWKELGSSYVISDILSAVLLGQLQRREEITARRGEIWNRYYSELKNWASASDVRLPFIPDGRQQSFHMFYLIMPSEDARNRFIDVMRGKGIGAVFHYLPLHESEFISKKQNADPCPVTSDMSRRLVRLPIYYNLSVEEQEEVLGAVKMFEC